MKRILIFTLILSALLIASCGASSATSSTTGDVYASANLPTDYENAMPVRNQLAIGTTKLDGTAQAVTPDQAKKLLPLYQALRGTSVSGGSSQQEISALLSQIESTMTAEQLAAIRDMKLTFADMQTWAAENGISLGSNGGQPGSGMGLSAEARATKQAAEGMTGKTPGSSGGGTAVMDAVINYLTKLAQ
ncbi:MAG: hypothetical protein PHQ36_07115 [Anaerolineales bacterium]|nr:hypothetical protein [Anaerolineales bacterium]